MDLSVFANQYKVIIVTFTTQFADGFGYTDDGEQVFIPRGLMQKYFVEQGDAVRCKVVRNDPKFQERCPWRAYHVEVLTKEDEDYEAYHDAMLGETQVLDGPESYIPTKEERLFSMLNEVEMMSTADVAALWHKDTNYTRPILERLHRDGKLVRADVFTHATQTKASRSMWAADDSVFQPLLQGENG